MANLAGKQKLILLYLTNCSCCTFFLPASSIIHFFPRSQFLTGDASKPIREGKKNGSDTCGRNYITINICAHLSIISDVQHHRLGIHKIFLWRTLRFFPCGFCSVVFPPLPFRLPFLMFTSHHTSERYV